MEKKEKKGVAQGLMRGIEKVGNKLPEPVSLFLIIGAIILVCSAIFNGVTELNPATGQEVAIVNLLNKEGLGTIIGNLGANMVGFAPLASVLLIMLGMGLCENVGMLNTLVYKVMAKIPEKLVVPMIVFLGVMLNMCGDVGFIVLPPLAGLMFSAIGRNPIAGIILAYGSVAGGFSANLLINTTDVVLLGFAQSAMDSIGASWAGNAAFNLYFMIASTIILIPVGTLINNRLVEPSLSTMALEREAEKMRDLTAEESKGLKGCGIGAVIALVIILILCVPSGAIMRNAETGSLLVNSPFVTSLPAMMAGFFFACGLGYGIGSGLIKSDKDVVKYIVASLDSAKSLILFAFAAGNMMNWFSRSNIGPIIAIKGANWLKSLGVGHLLLLLLFVFIASLINILISSNAAKFAILAPIFVPMLYYMGIDPAGTVVAYRIADSITNPITPMMAYMAIVITFCQKYKKDFGIGNFVSLMLPYTIGFAIFWNLLLVIWYVCNLPVGPGFSMLIGG